MTVAIIVGGAVGTVTIGAGISVGIDGPVAVDVVGGTSTVPGGAFGLPVGTGTGELLDGKVMGGELDVALMEAVDAARTMLTLVSPASPSGSELSEAPLLTQPPCLQTWPAKLQSSESLQLTRHAPREHTNSAGHCSSSSHARSTGRLHTPSFPLPRAKHVPPLPHSASVVHSARQASNAQTPERQSSVRRHSGSSCFAATQELMQNNAIHTVCRNIDGILCEPRSGSKRCHAQET